MEFPDRFNGVVHGGIIWYGLHKEITKVKTNGLAKEKRIKNLVKDGKWVIDPPKEQKEQDLITKISQLNTDQIKIPNEIIYGTSIIAQEDVNKALQSQEESKKEKKPMTDNDAKPVGIRDKTNPNDAFQYDVPTGQDYALKDIGELSFDKEDTYSLPVSSTRRFQQLYTDSGTQGTTATVNNTWIYPMTDNPTTKENGVGTYIPAQEPPLDILPYGADHGKCDCNACQASKGLPPVKRIKPITPIKKKGWDIWKQAIISSNDLVELDFKGSEDDMLNKGFIYHPEGAYWKQSNRKEIRLYKKQQKDQQEEFTRGIARQTYKIWTCFHMTDDYDRVIKEICDECKCKLK